MQIETTQETKLRRALSLTDLLVMGIVMVTPTAGMPPFGVIYNAAHGHVVTAILIAMFAMLFTAISYGRMARLYPAAGSAYTYVGREVHPLAGFATGWLMLLDYVVNPLCCTVWCASATHELVPAIPYGVFVILYAALFTAPGIFGIEASARANKILSVILAAGIVWVFIAFAQYVLTGGRWETIDLLRPFYDPKTFSWAALSSGAAVAVLTFIGFDGVSTLSEEAKDARQILPAIVLTCVIVGLLSALQVYGAQLVWPARRRIPESGYGLPARSGSGGRVRAATGAFLRTLTRRIRRRRRDPTGWRPPPIWNGTRRLAAIVFRQSAPACPRSAQQRTPHRRCFAGGSNLDRFLHRRRVVELRRTHRIHGCERVGSSPWLVGARLAIARVDPATPGRFSDLRLLVGAP
jgi:hypothetical protein